MLRMCYGCELNVVHFWLLYDRSVLRASRCDLMYTAPTPVYYVEKGIRIPAPQASISKPHYVRNQYYKRETYVCVNTG